LALTGTTLLEVVAATLGTGFLVTDASELVGVTSTFLALAAVGFMKLSPVPPPTVTVDRLPLVVGLMSGAAERVPPCKREDTKLELDPFRGAVPTAAVLVTAVRKEPFRDMLLLLLVMELREALELDRLRFSLELVVVALTGRLLDAVLLVTPPLDPLPFRICAAVPAGTLTRLVVELELLRLTGPPPDLEKVEEGMLRPPPITGLDLLTVSLLLPNVDLLRERVEELMLG